MSKGDAIGVPISESVVVPSAGRSSEMMSAQISTHSSQMKTLLPATSLRIWSCVLEQNEQYRASSSSFTV